MKKKMTSLDNNSVWYAHRDSLVGETFTVDGNRWTPVTKKAKDFAAAQGVEYFVFMQTAFSEDVKS